MGAAKRLSTRAPRTAQRHSSTRAPRMVLSTRARAPSAHGSSTPKTLLLAALLIASASAARDDDGLAFAVQRLENKALLDVGERDARAAGLLRGAPRDDDPPRRDCSNGEAVTRVRFEPYTVRSWDMDDLQRHRGDLFASSAAARRRYNATGGFRAAVGAALRRLDGASLTGEARCGSSPAAALAALRRGGTIALVARGHRKPSTLRLSLASWLASGLLDVVDERVAILSEPLPAEVALATRYGFDVRTPASLGLKGSLLPGATFAAAMRATAATYVLYLERHHSVAPGASREGLVDELAASALLLNRGAAFVRLRSSLDEACKCEGLKRVDWSSAAFSRGNNWWALHCPGGDDAPASHAETCLESYGAAAARAGGFDPLRFRCFTSEDSAWSLDAVLVDRNRTLREPWQFPSPYAWGAFREPTTLAAYAATDPSGSEWGSLKVPLCLSTRGLFARREVDGYDR